MAQVNKTNKFIPILVSDPDRLSIDEMTVLPAQPTLGDAFQSCVYRICMEYGWGVQTHKSNEIEEVREGVYKVTLHFVINDDDCDDGENGVIPADEWCYIFRVK